MISIKYIMFFLLSVLVFSANANEVKSNVATVNKCIPVKISSENDTITKVKVFGDNIIWNVSNKIFLWNKNDPNKKELILSEAMLQDVNNNRILYYKYAEGKYYLYDILKKTSTLLNLPKDAYKPVFDDKTTVFILNEDYSNTYLYYFDGVSNKQIAQCDLDGLYYFSPVVYNGDIVWTNKDESGYFQIYFKKGNGLVKITSSDFNNFSPDLENNKIVWEGNDLLDSEIYYWDGDKILKITDNDYTDSNPKLDGGNVFWYGFKDGDYEIFYWDGKNTFQLTDNDVNDILQDVSFGRIVWLQDEKDIYTCKFASTGYSLPVGKHVLPYSPVITPIVSAMPEDSKPIGVGNLTGGNLAIKVALKSFNSPVDIYFAIGFDKFKDKLFFISNNNSIQEQPARWKNNFQGEINTNLFGNIPTKVLPEGIYTLYLLVMPANTTVLNDYYLWVTGFNISR